MEKNIISFNYRETFMLIVIVVLIILIIAVHKYHNAILMNCNIALSECLDSCLFKL